MSALTDTFERYRAELAENTRLRLGLWAVLGLVLFYATLLQSDRVDAAYEEYAVEADRLARIDATLTSGDWQEWLRTEQAANTELAAQLWRADTSGLAQANVQAALGEIMAGLRLRNPRIRPGVSQAVPDAPGIWRVQMQLSASYRRGIELEVLHRVATYPRRLVVDRLDLNRSNDRIRLILSAYFLGVAPEDA